MKKLLAFVPLAAAVVWLACSNDSSAIKETLDASPVPTTDSGTDGAPDCFTNPTTHFEIINACTTATKIAKNPSLARLAPDGGLPPLP
jgi:hypothetical protein